VVENFENGITLENAILSQLRLNTAQNIVDKVAPWAGIIESNGFLLIASSFNVVSANQTQRTAHDGIVLTAASAGNTIQGNRIALTGFDHGIAWAGPWRPAGRGGCGVNLTGVNAAGAANNNNNLVLENECSFGDWGLQINGNSTGNVIARNYARDHTRAGVHLTGGANGNLVVENNAVGNGLENLAPSMTFDLFSNPAAGTNAWLRNKGTANFQ
jgi:hypothetical protein